MSHDPKRIPPPRPWPRTRPAIEPPPSYRHQWASGWKKLREFAAAWNAHLSTRLEGDVFANFGLGERKQP